MSIKIKVSYESPQELQEILKRLEPMLLSYKVSRTQEGRYKRAYIRLKNETNSERTEKTAKEQRRNSGNNANKC